MGVIGTWCRGHDGPTTLVALGVVGSGTAVLAGTSVPAYHDASLPFGLLTPALLAMVVALGACNRLPVPGRAAVRMVAARLLWAGVLLLAATSASALVRATYPVADLVPATAELAALALGSAVLLGKGAPVVGAASAGWLVLHAHDLGGGRSEASALALSTDPVAVAAAALSVLAYGAWGTRADNVI